MSGWCESLGTPDLWHDVCEQRMAAGWIKSCPCPNHARIDVQTSRSEAESGGPDGVESEAPRRVLDTPTPGLEQHETLRGSATRG